MNYRLLCEKALIAGPTLHCTLIYGWNLLTRPDTTFNVKWAHFARVDDHITATINKHKADQGGDSEFKIRSIFANPVDPIQCPFLSLFLVVITFTDTSFHGENFLSNEHVFNRWLKSAIDGMTESEQIMYGTLKKSLGPYSIRKGALSLCTCTPGGPPPAESHLRAGHTMGNTYGRYIHGSAGGDEMTGRMLCGGNLHSTTFASLPPHFRTDFIISEAEMLAIFPVYEKMKTVCPSFISCLPFLLASGVYHWKFVKTVLKDHQDHSIFTTAFSRENYAERYLPEVLVGEFYCDETSLRATGVPPLTSVLKAVSVVSPEPATGIDSQLQSIDVKLSAFMAETANSIRALGSKISTSTSPAQQQNPLSLLSTFNQTTVPSHFEMKTVKPMMLWALWYFGDAARNVKPYRVINGDEIIDKNTKTQLSRARRVIHCLEDIAIAERFITHKQRLLTLEYRDSIEVFHKCFEVLVRNDSLSTSNSKRPAELSFCSIYEKYVKKKK